MTNAIDMNIQNTQAGTKPASVGMNANAAGALGAKGIGGGQGLDFISLIMARLQTNGAIPQSVEGTPEASADALKAQVSAILADLGHTQAPAELAGNAELFQNGTAPLVDGQTLPNDKQANGLIDQITSVLQGDTPVGQAGIMNNGLLAQQLGLNPGEADAGEIIDALKQAFSDLGIELNTGGQSPQQSIEPQGPAQDISAHLNTLTSPQDQAQKPSPAQPEQKAAPDTSPLNAQVLADDTPLPQDTAQNSAVVAEAVTGDDFLLSQATLISNTGTAQSFMTAESALKTAARQARGPADQAADALQNAKGQTVKANGAAPQNSAPNSPSLPPQAADKAAEMMAHHSATTQNSVGSNGGAASTPNMMTDADFMNSFNNGQSNSLDAQLSQQFGLDNAKTQAKASNHSAFTAAQYRGATPQAPIRAVTMNMQRGINNAVDRMSLQMEPAELGRVKVDLKMGDDGMLKAHIMTDKPETLQILQKDSTILQKAFEEAGIDVGSESFSFDLRDQNDGQLAQDKNGRETLMNVADIHAMNDTDMDDAALINAGIYSQQYLRPNGVNLYV